MISRVMIDCSSYTMKAAGFLAAAVSFAQIRMVEIQ